MNLKTKISRKALAWLVSIIMIVSTIGFNPSFSAFANEQQEVDFCVDKMKNLPTDDEFLSQMRKLPTQEDLNQSRHEEIFHSDRSKDSVDLDKKEIYEEIKKTVEDLTKDFEIQESAEEMLDFAYNLEGEDDKEKIQTENSNDLPANMQKADAIYRWIAENIHYDFESFEVSKNPEKTLAKWNPQDEYFVFSQKTGVCEGYARLLNLMMRMAGIPCMFVGSINGPIEDYGHAFNAVYIEDEVENRKGWTLLDSCWASPHGSDGDAQIKIHLSGEMYFSNRSVEDALAIENEYTKELCNSFEVPENYWQNPNPEIIDNLNKKVPNVLKTLNEKYKDSPHFETIEFFDQSNNVYFKYKTNLTAEQAKQAQDNFKKLDENRTFKDLTDYLTGKLKECLTITFDDTNITTIEDLKSKTHFAVFLKIRLKQINDNSEKVSIYCDELQNIYTDLLFPNLNDDIDEKLEEINESLNANLEELNENYSDITTIKNINLSFKKDNEGFQILGEFDAGLDEQDLNNLFQQNKDNAANEAKKQKFEEFFPAFYKTDQSFEEANKSIVMHTLHKILDFETPSIETYLKINSPVLYGNEGKARLSLVVPYIWSEIKGEDMIEKQHKIYKFFNKVTISDDGIKFGDSPIYHNTYNFEINLPSYTENLTIEGDATIDISNAYGLKNIDTTKSRKYHAENGILYHTVDGKPGTKGEKIGEIGGGFG